MYTKLRSVSICLLTLLVGFLLGVPMLYAQNKAILEPELFYRNRIQFGANLNTSGLGGLNYKYGWHKTGKAKNMLDIEFARIRHPKETRIYGQSETPRKYTYGRLNMLFSFRTGYGQTIAITERPYRNALSVNFNYTIGLSTAILKPIYLDIFHPNLDGNGGSIKPERYDPAIPNHNNQNYIFGNSTFFEGIENTQLKLGAYGKASVSVEWGEYTEDFQCLEAGVALDVYPSPLALMAFQPKNYYLINLFIGYSFGWNK